MAEIVGQVTRAFQCVNAEASTRASRIAGFELLLAQKHKRFQEEQEEERAMFVSRLEEEESAQKRRRVLEAVEALRGILDGH